MRELDQEPPEQLLRDLAAAPLMDESEIEPYIRGWMSHEDPTPAELDVLRCLSHGMTAPMAAEALGRAESTVRKQMRAARWRLKAKNPTHAVAVAIRAGYID